MSKIYRPNLVQNQNIAVASNITWTADITHLELQDRLLSVFICIDLYSNEVITDLVSTKGFTSRNICRALQTQIDLCI